MKGLSPNFNISNEVKTIHTKFKFNFRKTIKKVCSIWGKVSRKEENYFDKVFKGKVKNSGFFHNVKLKEQAIHILHGSNKEYCEKYKTTLTKQAKEIFDIPNAKLIACTITENIEFQMEGN